MRPGPALLVALLLPLLAGADFTRTTSNEDEPAQSGQQQHSSFATIPSSNNLLINKPKTTSGTSSKSSVPSANSFSGKGGKFTEVYFDPRSDHYQSKYSVKSDNQHMLPLYKKKKLTVGYLTAIKGDLPERQGLVVSGALTLALEKVCFKYFYY